MILLYPSANRDESVFDDPYTFDITRRPNPHVAFGFGTHFCLGAALARLELRVLFSHLARRITNLRVLAEPDIEPNIFVGAVRSLRARLRPALDDPRIPQRRVPCRRQVRTTAAR